MGIANISISYKGSWDATTISLQPKTIIQTIGKNKHKTEILLGNTSLITIHNYKDSSQVILIGSIDKNIFCINNKNDILQEFEKDGIPKITYSNETKKILGYTCKKAEISKTDIYYKNTIVTVFYSEEIGNHLSNWGTYFQGIEGFPMEYTIKTEEGEVSYIVKKLKKHKISEKEFIIPEGYEKISSDEFKYITRHKKH
jgi:GLPGLI family protein